MVFKHLFNLKNFKNGATLIEVIVAIFILVLFSTVMISNFPQIFRRFAVTRVTYKLAQDLGKIRDLGFSGVYIKDVNENNITSVKGYGIYINTSSPTQYILYADIATITSPNGTKKFENTGSEKLCDQYNYNSDPRVGDEGDCIIDIVDVTDKHPDVRIKYIGNIAPSTYTSINFSPPNPNVNIDNLNAGNSEIAITLGLTSDTFERTVYVNISGLINAQ